METSKAIKLNFVSSIMSQCILYMYPVSEFLDEQVMLSGNSKLPKGVTIDMKVFACEYAELSSVCNACWDRSMKRDYRGLMNEL